MSAPKKFTTVASDALLDALVDASVDGIIVIDTMGTVLLFNAGAERMFDFAADQVLGHNVNMLMSDQDRHQHDDYLNRYISTGERRIIGLGREVVGKRRSGQTFPLDLAVGESSEQGLFVGILRDLSQREHLKDLLQNEREQVRDLERSLAHVHRASTLGEMAAGIAHEINQPLAAISTYADAGVRLLESGQAEEKIAYALAQIGQQARRAGDVVTRMRAMASQDSGALESVDINGLVRDLLELAQLEAREIDAPIRLDLGSNLPSVTVDAVQIQQVLLNLIRNGLEAMVKRSQAEQGLTVRTSVAGASLLQVSVEDHGMGVPEHQREAIFDAFHTTKAAGMGMGLSICRTIIQRHGGRLWHEHLADGGSQFCFNLPVAAPLDKEIAADE